MQEIPIKDIKPLVEIPDFSIFLFISIIVFGSFVLIALTIFLVKYIKKRRENLKKSYLKILKSVDFSNPKESAYAITKYGRLLIYDDRSKQIFETLEQKLQAYKYKKEVESFDDEVKKYYNLFLEIVNG